MHKPHQTRMRAAWLLLAIYVPLLLAVSLHRHNGCGETAAVEYCQECAHNIHHGGHLTAQQTTVHECVLCQLQSMPCVVPLTLFTLPRPTMRATRLVRQSARLKPCACRRATLRAPPRFS